MPDEDQPGRFTKRDARRIAATVKAHEGQRIDRTPARRHREPLRQIVKVYVATSNVVAGEITGEWCDSSGNGDDNTITFKVLP